MDGFRHREYSNIQENLDNSQQLLFIIAQLDLQNPSQYIKHFQPRLNLKKKYRVNFLASSLSILYFSAFQLVFGTLYLVWSTSQTRHRKVFL
jgi:hypothetical protein